jgi:hypothetical protein
MKDEYWEREGKKVFIVIVIISLIGIIWSCTEICILGQ